MADLSSLTDDQLRALYSQPAPAAAPQPADGPTHITVRPEGAVDLSKMSDADLKAAYDAQNTSTLGDVAKSAGIGLVKGAIGLAGLPGDIRSTASSAADTIGGKLGIDQGTIDTAKNALSNVARFTPANIFNLSNSNDIQSGIEDVTGKFYEPKTTAGHVAQTIGEFAPAVIGGPESLAAKAVTRVALPALASEGAGALTKGTALEPVARVGGAILGGVGGARAIAPRALAAPTAEELGVAAKQAYEHPTVKALELNPSSTSFASGKITDALNNSGFRQLTAPQTYSLVQELKTPLGPTSKIADIQSVRTALGKVAGNFSNPVEAAAATKAIKGIDSYLANLKPFDVAAGDAKAAASILNEAKGNYAAKSRMERFDNAEYRAELNAASAHSGGNINNATRQALKAILFNKSKRRGFSPDEIAMMEKVVKGTATGNVMRAVGKLLATSGMHGGLVGAGSITAAPATHGLSLAIPAIGYAAKKIGDRSTANAIRALDRTIAMRSPLGAAMPAQAPSTNPAIAGLLSGLLESRSR